MGDDDDDGDADDSPTVQYTRQDSLKGKNNPESGQAAGVKLEGLQVRSPLVSLPPFCSLTFPDGLPSTSPPPRIRTCTFTNSPCIRRPSYSTPCLQQPRCQLTIVVHNTISESAKAYQGRRPPECSGVTHPGQFYASTGIRPLTFLARASSPRAAPTATSSTASLSIRILPGIRTRFGNSTTR